MERDNQETQKISIAEAKRLLLTGIGNLTSPEYPHGWVGEYMGTVGRGYVFPICPYKDGENPEDHCIKAWVNYVTGEINLAPDLNL